MIAIDLKNITKTYKIYKKPVYRIVDSFIGTKHYSEYHALNDISLSIEQGEAVGVLGKNGAGKSTLLKILTGVTTPTSGDISVNGKIAAILELNSGFDEELSGRENIFLKGTILGYSKEEMLSKVDDIVEFADIGRYIEQPVRTYSSGMKSRLGFAIAVNSNPDILIIDEALSVGDDVFKTKCLTKMSEFRKMGKTIFFVSHSIFTIKSFCTKCAWLKDGKLMDYGDTGSIVAKYENFLKEEKSKELKTTKKDNCEEYLERKDYIGISQFKFSSKNSAFSFNEDIEYSFNYNVKKDLGDLRWTFTIRDSDDKEIYSTNKMGDEYKIDSAIGNHQLKVILKSPSLLPGKYKLSGEIRNDTGIIYVGYANKKVFSIKSNKVYIGSGTQYIKHMAKNEE